MTHLALGLDPEHIRLAPYTPTVLEAPVYAAAEIGIEIAPAAPVLFSPCVGSYVGGDITAGVLLTDLASGNEDISLFIDVGTNGEIVIGNRDFLLTCACSAGPAFEGGGIDRGMRAAPGAISAVRVNPANGEPSFSVIGGGEPRGICGSGMIDLVAELFLSGWLDAAGRLDRTRSARRIDRAGRRASYELAGDHEGKRSIRVSETDIENIMRAKAAIYAASALMLGSIGISYNDISRFYVAGGFGRTLDVENAVAIGLLPDVPRDRFAYIGNASLIGSCRLLVSQKYRALQGDLSRRMTYLEPGADPRYRDHYTAALFLPHTDGDLVPSVRGGYARRRLGESEGFQQVQGATVSRSRGGRTTRPTSTCARARFSTVRSAGVDGGILCGLRERCPVPPRTRGRSCGFGKARTTVDHLQSCATCSVTQRSRGRPL